MNRLNASDISIASARELPPYFTPLLANPITQKNDKEIKGVVSVITYMRLHQNAVGALTGDEVLINYNGVTVYCYVLDFWQETHDKHKDNILGNDVKTVIELEVIE